MTGASAKLCAGMLLIVSIAGCATNAITGDSTRHEQIYHGVVGITGADHEITIEKGSQVPKLSIMGADNSVFIQDGAVVEKIEIVGEDNDVSCPVGLVFEFTQIGEDNRVTHRR